jgi:pimeloyl-ACP methyl ester carboxylesterase
MGQSIAQQFFNSPKAAFNAVKQAAHFYFFGANDDSWGSRKIGSPQKAIDALGYDLDLEYIYPKNRSFEQSITLYLHGWGDIKNSARLLKKFSTVLDDNIVTFNFPDARPIIGKITQSSFGQLSDTLAAIYAAHATLQEFNLTSLNIFGISRGGATAINMLALLNDQELFSKHQASLRAIGVDQEARKKILQAVQNGTITLDIPLRSMKHTPMPLALAQQITLYDAKGWESIDMVKRLKGLYLTSLVHFQHDDAIVSNKNEAEFFFYLAINNPHTTYLVMGNDGGHLHTHNALSRTAGFFKRVHTCINLFVHPFSIHCKLQTIPYCQKSLYVWSNRALNQMIDKVTATLQVEHCDFLVACNPAAIVNGFLVKFSEPCLDDIKNAVRLYHDAEAKKSFFSTVVQWLSSYF